MIDPYQLKEVHLSSITLTNKGIVLLETGAYRQALQTFENAILAMKRVVRIDEGIGSPSMATESDRDETIDGVVQRIQAPDHEPLGSPAVGEESRTHDAIETEFPRVEIPIRIETSVSATILEQDLELETAVMLYNYGIAHTCIAKVSKSTYTILKMRNSALELYDLAFSLVLTENAISFLQMNDTRLRVAYIFLSSIVQLLTELGQTAAAVEYFEKLGRLERALDLMERAVD